MDRKIRGDYLRSSKLDVVLKRLNKFRTSWFCEVGLVALGLVIMVSAKAIKLENIGLENHGEFINAMKGGTKAAVAGGAMVIAGLASGLYHVIYTLLSIRGVSASLKAMSKNRDAWIDNVFRSMLVSTRRSLMLEMAIFLAQVILLFLFSTGTLVLIVASIVVTIIILGKKKKMEEYMGEKSN